MLVKVLIIIFTLLLIYQLFLATFEKLNEGMENSKVYKEYDKNDSSNTNSAMILAQQNAGNIEFLKEQISGLNLLDKKVTDLSVNMVGLNEQLNQIGKQQAMQAQALVGSQPLEITGLTGTSSSTSIINEKK